MTKFGWEVIIFIKRFKKQLTIISIIMQAQANFCLGFTKINTTFFVWSAKASINTNRLDFQQAFNANFCDCHFEMMDYLRYTQT